MYPTENLIEGNHYEHHNLTLGDSFWGQQGKYNTFYRNRGLTATYLRENPVKAPPSHIYANIMGNIFFALTGNIPSGCYPLGTCGHIDQSGIHPHFSWNIGWDPAVHARRGLNMRGDPNTDCGTGEGGCETTGSTDGDAGCTNDPIKQGVATSVPGFCYNLDAVSVAQAEWAGFDIPNSMYFDSRADWEAQAGAVWCAEACDFDDVYNGIGAWSDDIGGTLCKLPAEIWKDSETCSRITLDPSTYTGASLIGGSTP
jgi:hypothetical protein